MRQRQRDRVRIDSGSHVYYGITKLNYSSLFDVQLCKLSTLRFTENCALPATPCCEPLMTLEIAIPCPVNPCRSPVPGCRVPMGKPSCRVEPTGAVLSREGFWLPDHEGLPAPLWLHLEQRTVERRSEINKSLSLREPLCFCLCSHSTERRVVAGSGPAELKN